jgi:hypothetical protein
MQGAGVVAFAGRRLGNVQRSRLLRGEEPESDLDVCEHVLAEVVSVLFEEVLQGHASDLCCGWKGMGTGDESRLGRDERRL